MELYERRAAALAKRLRAEPSLVVETKHYPASMHDEHDRHYVLVREVGKPDIHYDMQYNQFVLTANCMGSMYKWNKVIIESMEAASTTVEHDVT